MVLDPLAKGILDVETIFHLILSFDELQVSASIGRVSEESGELSALIVRDDYAARDAQISPFQYGRR
jgi:hypothetical protein